MNRIKRTIKTFNMKIKWNYLIYKKVTIVTTLMVLFFFCQSFSQVKANKNQKPNVLFISIDDLNDWINPVSFGGLAGLKTPNYDRLANMGMTFTNAHVASPACAPSRVAIMTGVHPVVSGVTGWQYPKWRERPALQDVQTIEQFFKAKGYTTLAGGKIYHTLAPPRTVISQSEAKGWDYYFPGKAVNIPFQIRAPEKIISPENFVGTQPPYFTWGPIELDDDYMADYQIVEWAKHELNQAYDQPVFLAVGLTKPHDPWEVPQKYFDLYPLDSVPDLEIQENDLLDAYIHGRRPLHKFILDNKQRKKVIQAYMASISFTDAMLGRLLDAYEESTYRDNTIIVLWSDHGMHMGEKENWEKFTLWERSTRAPLFFMAPGITKGGSSTHIPVGHIDIFPTLAELIGEKAPAYTDGESLLPMLRNESFDHKPVLSAYALKEDANTPAEDVYAIRTNKYRYIYYPFTGLEELYDHQVDKNEWNNIAYHPDSKKIVTEVRALLSQRLPNINWSNGTPFGYEISAKGEIRKINYMPIERIKSTTPWY